MSIHKLTVAHEVAEFLGMTDLRATESVYSALEALSLAGMSVDVEKLAQAARGAPSSAELTMQMLQERYKK